MSEKKPLPPLESREQAQIRSSEFLRQYDEGLEIGHLRRTGQMSDEEFWEKYPHARKAP